MCSPTARTWETSSKLLDLGHALKSWQPLSWPVALGDVPPLALVS